MCSLKKNEKRGKRKTGCCHINTLSSLWCGIFISILQVYIVIQTSNKLIEYKDLGWPELRGAWVSVAAAVLGLPIFIMASLFKVGNLANDGFKLGRTLSTCEADPKDPLSAHGMSALWRHGGPTAPFIHIFIAFCLLLPKLILLPRLIQSGYLSKDYVWKTDLDFIVSSYDRLVVLSFMAPSTENSTFKSSTPFSPMSTSLPSPQSMFLSTPDVSVYDEKWGPVSIEFFNYALALAVYAVRYPAVFWNTNKYWGSIFSFQLFINGIQMLLIFTGASVLYRVHFLGPNDVLSSMPLQNGKGFFLLNPHVTLALFFLTTAFVLSSSLVLYLYGYGRFNSFLSHEKACKVISVEGKEWGYLTHCTALCVLLAITVVEGPLLVDLAVIYKSTLDMSVLICVIGTVFHLFIWVVLWLGLTLKQNWEFKLRVTVGKAAVRSAKSIKLLTDVELVSSCEVSAPLLVVASGRTYTVCDTSPKKTIISAIHKAAMERKAKLQANSGTREQIEENEEQIYWLRPKPMSPKNSPDSEMSERISWCRKVNSKPKVTFDQSVKKMPLEDCMHDDDGDYARLRELPLLAEGSSAPENQLIPELMKAPNQCSSRLLQMSRDYEDPSPLLTPDPPDLPPPPGDTPTTPRCLRRGDSGMLADLTPRSDSETSASPPDHSETSSGVHSNSSRESNNGGGDARPEESNEDMSKLSFAQWKNQNLRGAATPSESREIYIRRRMDNEAIPMASSPQDQFGRSTNMRMTSFTDAQSATLPHFPTQQVGMPYPHCSTMPLPPVINPSPMHGTPNNNYPRQHTTIPTHHNGVRLFNPTIYAKRFNIQRYHQHHSFPHLLNHNKINLKINEERDSANYSMASSSESDTYPS